MITTKDYVWPVVKETVETVWGFLFQVILGAVFTAFVIAVIHFLQWFSIVIFAILAFCYYVWREAHFNYKFEKDEAERKARDHLAWMIRLPAYWSIEEEEEKNNESYKQATKDFIEIMDEYERKYGKNDFYEKIHSEWLTADKYLRDALINKTF